MLDARITAHVENAARVKAGAFSNRLRDALNAPATGGMSASESVAQTLRDHPRIFRDQLEFRARFIFDAMKEALQLYPPELLTDELTSYLNGLHITETRKQCTELQREADGLPNPGLIFFVAGRGQSTPVRRPRLNIATGLNDRCDQLREEFQHDIMAHIQSLRLARAQVGQTGSIMTINNTGTIGALQTGASSSAHVVVNIGQAEREALLKAIDALRDALIAAQDTEAVEIVEAARSAAAEEQPKRAVVRGLLIGLPGAMRTAAAVTPAWELVRIAAKPLGIELPGLPSP